MAEESATTGFLGYRWRPWKVFLIVIGGLLLVVGLITGALGGDDASAAGIRPVGRLVHVLLG